MDTLVHAQLLQAKLEMFHAEQLAIATQAQSKSFTPMIAKSF